MCKLFDTFLPFTVHLLLIAKMHFRKIALIKPNQSRPANSERSAVDLLRWLMLVLLSSDTLCVKT